MSREEIACFRDLHDEILGHRRYSLYAHVLERWIDASTTAMRELKRFRTPTPFVEGDFPARSNFYALNRCNDVLINALRNNGRSHLSDLLTRGDYETFFTYLGFEVVSPDQFSPFFHEIVEVEQSPDDTNPIAIHGESWPALMWGEMLFSRAGAWVSGGRNHIVKEIAENSTLYFTHDRRPRRTTDLSVGWGANSQWKTDIRRDYQCNTLRIYNYDGKNLCGTQQSGQEDRDGLTPLERLELCKNRCFLTCTKPDHDLFPYDDRYEEKV